MKSFMFTLVSFVLFTGSLSFTSGQQVTGTVTSFKSIPLRNVVIKSLITGKSVLSDSLGRYHIESAPDEVLSFSASGFSERKIKVRKSTVVNADLKYLFSETSFNEAVGNDHIGTRELKKILEKYPLKGEKDYSHYQNIYELIRGEITNVRVVGTAVYSVKAISFSLSSQVLYVVDSTVISDISFISPVNVKRIEYLEDTYAADYGMRGANGVIRITLKNK